MATIEEKIVEALEEVLMPDQRKAMVIKTGIVQAVDYDTYTCTVCLNVNSEDTITDGITINAALEVQEGLILFPAGGSVVWVAELDGGGNMGVIKCSQLDQVFLKIGGDVSINANGSYIEMKAGGGLHLLMASGKFKIENGSKNLYGILDNIIRHVRALTVTAAGSPSSVPINQPDFVQDSLDLQALLTA